jgi:hypothetical protein
LCKKPLSACDVVLAPTDVIYPVLQTWYFKDKGLQFLFMGVSGIDIKEKLQENHHTKNAESLLAEKVLGESEARPPERKAFSEARVESFCAVGVRANSRLGNSNQIGPVDPQREAASK